MADTPDELNIHGSQPLTLTPNMEGKRRTADCPMNADDLVDVDGGTVDARTESPWVVNTVTNPNPPANKAGRIFFSEGYDRILIRTPLES